MGFGKNIQSYINNNMNHIIGLLQSGLMVYFKFNETSGTVATSTIGSGATMDLNGAVFVPGKIGNGIDVQGVDTPSCNSGVPFELSKNLPFSFNFWYKPTTISSNTFMSRQKTISTKQGYVFYINGGLIVLSFYGNTNTNWWRIVHTSTITVGNWYNISIVYTGGNDPANVKLYINGVLVNKTSTTGHQVNTLGTYDFNGVSTFKFGCSGDNSSQAKGVMDNLASWDRALTIDEIYALYNSGSGIELDSPDSLPPYSTLPISLTNYFKFNETSGTTATSTKGGGIMDLNGAGITTGRIGNGIDVQSGDYPTCTTTSHFTLSKYSPFSISFWYKPSVIDERITLMSKERNDGTYRKGYEFYILDDPYWGPCIHLDFYSYNTDRWELEFPLSMSGITMSVDNWYNITIVYTGPSAGATYTDPENLSLYLNNVLVTRHSGFTSYSFSDFNDTSTSFKFGVLYDNTYPAKGVMDNLATWSRALTIGEISTLYNSGVGIEF